MERKRKSKAKSNQLQIGDKVIIANRFFLNHGMKRHLVGEGKVLYVSLFFIRVEFKYHSTFAYCKTNGFIKGLAMPVKDIAVIDIHPVYLEKVK
jgi:hypothetical protein